MILLKWFESRQAAPENESILLRCNLPDFLNFKTTKKIEINQPVRQFLENNYTDHNL